MAQSVVHSDLEDIRNSLEDVSQSFSGKTILVSGGEGFLGTHLIAALTSISSTLPKPVRIISLDNRITSGGDTVASPSVEYITADVSLGLSIREPINYIIHAAGLASPVHYLKYPLETIRSAVHGTQNLLELARTEKNFDGFLYFSSSEIYGDPDPRFVPTPETYHGHVSSIGPRACYDESKRLGETITTIYNERFKVPTVIVRPFNVFGPYMRPDDYRVIPTFVHRALSGLPLQVHVGGPQTRTFCYISDALTGFLRALVVGTRGGVYNIGSASDEISIKDLADKFVDRFPGLDVKAVAYPDRYPGGEPQRRCPDLTKAMKEIGYTYGVSLDEGLDRFIEWARHDPSYQVPPNS